MGFRSKMMTEYYGGIIIPDWFLSKHPQYHYEWDRYQPLLSISSRIDRKFYSEFNEEEVFVDLQRVLVEGEHSITVAVVLLHECGGLTLVQISPDKIVGREPTAWKEVTGVEHNYCYGCSEPK